MLRFSSSSKKPLLVLGASVVLYSTGCDQETERPLPTVPSGEERSDPLPAGTAKLPDELDAGGATDADADAEPPPPHPGPWFVVTRTAAGIYSAPKFDKELKIAYARNGGRLPVLAEAKKTDSCTGGWYEHVAGGYVCGNSGTTKEDSKEAKFVQTQPNFEDILPYRYARNSKNGTPLYKSIPSREQMLAYEPYLDKQKADKQKADKQKADKQKADKQKADKQKPKEDPPKEDAGPPTDAGALGDPDASPLEADLDAAASEPEPAWWQRENVKELLPTLTKDHLTSEADGVLAMRMVSGFYIAVDKTFSWNDRRWYRTTKGLVAPTDRFWQTSGSDFKGVELGSEHKLPVAWVYGGYKSTTTYAIDREKNKITPDGSIKRFVAIDLTGETTEFGKTKYYETKAGLWIKARHIRVTEPGPEPEELKPGERWIDINLSQQTIVALEGDQPVYASLISSGKTSSVKAKDHRTPSGTWRIRVKHVADTMDGDGTAAGDLPYSIEDVPYVMYFHRSYALHAAFWHRNYGVRMSHGCINLAPLDAKWLFLFAEPKLPEGAHGVFSSGGRPGTLVTVH